MKYKLLRILGNQEWIRLGIRLRIIKLFVPLYKVDYDYKIIVYGNTYSGNLKSYIDWCVYFLGIYEKKLLKNIEKVLKSLNKCDTFLDIGANVGNHALFLSRFATTIHCFEPYYFVREKLQKNISSNNITKIIIHPFAVGLEGGKLSLHIPINNNWGSATLHADRINSNDSIEVEIVNGDEYVSKLNIKQIDFIKIDVEGHEIDVLRGLKNVIKKMKPIIWFELSTNDEFHIKKEFLKELFVEYSFKNLEDLKDFNLDIAKAKCEYNVLAIPKIK